MDLNKKRETIQYNNYILNWVTNEAGIYSNKYLQDYLTARTVVRWPYKLFQIDSVLAQKCRHISRETSTDCKCEH